MTAHADVKAHVKRTKAFESRVDYRLPTQNKGFLHCVYAPDKQNEYVTLSLSRCKSDAGSEKICFFSWFSRQRLGKRPSISAKARREEVEFGRTCQFR